METGGNRCDQLEALRRREGFEDAWMTRASYSVLHLVLSAKQADRNLEVRISPGLFFAGRAAGSCNYSEAAALGTLAGMNAARRAGGKAPSSVDRKVYLCYYNCSSASR